MFVLGQSYGHRLLDKSLQLTMRTFNILFQFRNRAHIANVHFSSRSQRYTIYFTDVELILEFGSKAEYTTEGGLVLLKNGKDLEALKAVIISHLLQLTIAA